MGCRGIENCMQGYQGGLPGGGEVVMDSEGQEECGQENGEQHERMCVCIDVRREQHGSCCLVLCCWNTLQELRAEALGRPPWA